MTEEQRANRRYTIEDIAKELGISKTTVSRAISGKGRLSPETRAKVLDFIEKHHYRPNAVAKSLAHSRSFNVGLILPEGIGAKNTAFFHECMLGVCEVAARHDYDVLLTVDTGRAGEQMQRAIDNHKVDGVIAARSEVNSPVLSLLKTKQIPYVIIGAAQEPGVLCVDNNNQKASSDLVSVLISRGARRMSLLCDSENYCVTHSRRDGFWDACRQFRLPQEEQLIFRDLSDSGQVARAIDESLRQRVDCIVCMDAFLCNLALGHLRERKACVPEDVKVACFYDDPLLECMTPPVTSLRFDAVELGRAACRELLRELEGEGAQSRILPGYQIVLRDSTN